MIVSIIGGTGPQGLGIGERLAIEGVDVIIGSRKEEKAFYSNEVFNLMKEFRKEKSEFITCEPPYEE